MAWVCLTCESDNDEMAPSCVVCGDSTRKPARSPDLGPSSRPAKVPSVGADAESRPRLEEPRTSRPLPRPPRRMGVGAAIGGGLLAIALVAAGLLWNVGGITGAPCDITSALSSTRLTPRLARSLSIEVIRAARAHVASIVNAARVEPLDEATVRRAARELEAMNVRSSFARGDRPRARAANEKGLARVKAKDYTAGLAVLINAHQADPGDVEILNNLGYAYLMTNQLCAGEATLTLAVFFAPRRASAWSNLGETYAREQRGIDAVAAFLVTLLFSRDRATAEDHLRTLVNGADAAVRAAADRTLKRWKPRS